MIDRIRPSLLAAAALLVPASAAAQEQHPYVSELDHLDPSAGVPDDQFGSAVAFDGDRAVVGARARQAYRGAAYVYERSGGAWVQAAELLPSPAQTGAAFGGAVALDGDTIAVGAEDFDGGFASSGAVFVFRRTGGAWVQEARLEPQQGTTGGYFGRAVALVGDVLVVGAPGEVAQQGRVHVYQRSGSVWTLAKELMPIERAWFAGFGSALSFDGARLAVGAPDHLGGGRAYVFEPAGGAWNQIATLDNETTQEDAGYGSSVSLFGSRVAVGAALAAPVPPHVYADGAVYVYEDGGSGYPLASELRPPFALPPSSRNRFGLRVVGEGDELAISSAGSFPYSSEGGFVYVYRHGGGGWSLEVELRATDSFPSDAFGFALDFQGGEALVGAPELVTAGAVGRAYSYQVVDPVERYCAAMPNSTGAPARIDFAGSNAIALDDFGLRAEPLPEQLGIFFYGSAAAQLPFGDGFRCVAGTTFRLPVVPVSNGVLAYELDQQLPPPGGAIQAGSTWFFQAWYRDPAAGLSGFNLSDGLRVTFYH